MINQSLAINSYYTNGFHRVVLVGVHPMKDFVALSSGTDEDIRWVSFHHFFSKYKLDT